MVEMGWDGFSKIAQEEDAGLTGVRKHVHWEAASSPKDKTSAPYLDIVENFQEREAPDVPGGYDYAWRYTTFFVDTTLYLPYLKDRLVSQGGIIKTQHFNSMSEVSELPTDIIFNCTGLGARDLLGDTKIHPIRGQAVLVAPRPAMDWSISADGFYVYPRSKDTVLGGTAEFGRYSPEPEASATQLLIKGNKRILPDLTPAEIKKSYVGLRPYREETIRVEFEEINDKQVVHNYGHGGSGVTMSWGSARIALEYL